MGRKLPRRNRSILFILSLCCYCSSANAVIESKKPQPTWSKSSQWLYGALTARFQDQAGKYALALNSVGDVAIESREYDALEYSYGLAWDTRDLQYAEKIARVWLSAFPSDNEARLALLRVLLVDGRGDEALSQMSELLHLDSGPQNVAQIFRSLTDFPDSDVRLSLLQKLSQEFPKNPYLYYYIGVMAKEQGKVSAAMQAFNHAISLDANWRELELMQAQVLASIGKLHEARKIMNRMRKRYPEDTAILSVYIDMLTGHYQWEEALKLAQQWQKLRPKDVNIQQLIAQLYASEGNYPAALNAFKKILHDHQIDINSYLFFVAHAAERAGQYKMADEMLGEIDKNSNLYIRAQEQRALIYFKERKIDKAQAQFKKLREDFPDDAQVLDTYLVEAAQLQQEKQWDRLKKLLDEALKHYPNQVDLLYVLAEYQAAIGDLVNARQQFEKILSLDSANIDALNAYGYLLLTQTKEQETAAKMIEEAIRAYPDSPAIQDSYGWLLYQQGKTEQALLWLRRAYAAYRSNEIAAHYIEVLFTAGEKDLAKEVYFYEKKGQPDNIYLHNVGKKLGFTHEK